MRATASRSRDAPDTVARCVLVIALAVVCACSGSSDRDAASVPAQDPEFRDHLLHGRYSEAERVGRERLASAEKEHGADSLEAARAMDLVVGAMVAGGRYDDPEALVLAERSLELKERHVGPDHLDTAVSLRNLATTLRYRYDLSRAEEICLRVLDIRLDHLDDDDPAVAEARVDLASVYLLQDRYAEARPLLERALKDQKSRLAPDDQRIGRTLHNQGLLGHWSGDYAAGRAAFLEALEIQGWLADDVLTVRTYDALANLLQDLGDYDEAERRYRYALDVREQRLGAGHREVAWGLNNLARLLMRTGEYVEARALLERSLAIEESILGPDHADVAIPLSNLADLRRMMGDLDRAEESYRRALRIRETSLGENRSEVARSCWQLAGLLYDMERYEDARRLYERARDIWEVNVGNRHKSYATALDGLADVDAVSGKRDDALALYGEALDIREEQLGGDHPDVARSMISVAALRHEQGRASEARDLYRRAVEIRSRSLGENHPETASAMVPLARTLLQTGAEGEALRTSLRAEEIGIDHLRVTLRSLGEREALRYSLVRASGRDVALSLAAGRLTAGDVEAVWNAVIRSRAAVLDEMATRRHSIVTSTDPEVARLAAELQSASRRLANLVVRGPPFAAHAYPGLVQDAAREKEEAERKLAAKSTAFRQKLAADRAELDDIVGELPERSALVAYVRYEHHEGNGSVEERSVPSYLALVHAGPESAPIAVPLGRAGRLDDLVRRWRESVARGPIEEREDPAGAEKRCRATGDVLRRAVWDPVTPHLPSVARVFIVPDGVLHLVSFAALPTGSDGYLVADGPTLHLLSAERDLVKGAEPVAAGTGLLALGGPAYDSEVPLGDAQRGRGGSAAPASTFRGGRTVCGDFRNVRFGPLPSSLPETAAIVGLWEEMVRGSAGAPVVHLTGDQAGETAFKERAPGRKVLHVATHGYFVGGDCPSDLDGTRGIGGVSSWPAGRLTEVAAENPLLLSGLALAGANRRNLAGPDEDDGILTAEEVAAMDLTGVAWAVLSACDTGVGEVMTGEGVLGLRRAFRIAGADTVIMSLWAVEDESTGRWMQELYAARLESGMSTADAVREATLRLIRTRGDEGLSTHPFYWGGFVAAGKWR